jgi:hypothetical protein
MHPAIRGPDWFPAYIADGCALARKRGRLAVTKDTLSVTDDYAPISGNDKLPTWSQLLPDGITDENRCRF